MWPVAFFARELAPTPRRFVEATRTALKATITTGISATLQIVGPFGSLFAFRIGQPGISFGLFEGSLTIASAAVMQAAIVPITGKLLDYPGLIMSFLFVVFAEIAYLLSNTRLFLILALVAIGTITTVYVGIFEPSQIGWASTYTFDGILAATLTMVAIDTWIWPSPPELGLLESIADDFERSRQRFKLVTERYLDPHQVSLPEFQLASRMAPHLTLFKSVEERSKLAPGRIARLLDAVATAERVYMEVERLAVLADEPVSSEVIETHRDQLRVLMTALDAALARRSEDLLAGLPDSDISAGELLELQSAISHLKEFSRPIRPTGRMLTRADASNFAVFIGALETLANLLEPLPVSTAPPFAAEDDEFLEPPPAFDWDRFRFSVKLGATVVLGLLVGLTTQRADLQTILWSIAVAGQPNQFGAVLRKTILRLAGCLIGGLAALGAMLIVSQNFDSLPPYLVVIFLVTIFSTYVSQSSEWLNYAGIQTGITFLICYVGLGPSTDVYRPLWRFWGIVLGVLTTGFVFLFLWPEYASDKLTDRLARLLRTAITFAHEVVAGTITERQIVAVERRLSKNLLDALNVADQARLEGTVGSAYSEKGVEAAAAITRIAYRFEVIARGHLAGSEPPLPQDTREQFSALEKQFCEALESSLRILEPGESSEDSGTSLQPPRYFDTASVTDQVAVGGDSRYNAFEAQLESYRRLPILLRTLGDALSHLVAR